MRASLDSLEGAFRGYRTWLVALVRAWFRRLLARAAGLAPAEIDARWPLPLRPAGRSLAPAGALPPDPQAPGAALAVPEVAPKLEVSPELLRAARPETVLATDGSPIPPNVEKAVGAQLRSSHRESMKGPELARFLEGLGVAKPEVAAIVQRMRLQLRRDELSLQHLPLVQGWVSERWVASRAKQRGRAFAAEVVREVAPEHAALLDFQEPASVVERLDAGAITALLVRRGWSNQAAGGLAKRLVDAAKLAAKVP